MTAWPLESTYPIQVPGLHANWSPTPVPDPELVLLNDDLAVELGLDPHELRTPEQLAVFAGNDVPAGSTPIAQAYAGHQFGSYSPLLGDGRALLLGELVDCRGRRRDIALKGSGRTPFSRGGDGKATLGPVLREYLMGEAMHALGIPTSRGLAAVRTGEQIRRQQLEPGAVLTRVAASHLRIGTFEYARRGGTPDQLRALADHAIARHHPAAASAANRYAGLLGGVVAVQADLIAGWMAVGFIHGVMNTDNTTISGETIDYGPCAFMEAYDENAVFSSIDHGGRYRFGNQPGIAAWNLARLAECLLPLLAEDVEEAVDLANAELAGFAPAYDAARARRMRAKLGLPDERPEDAELAADLLGLLGAGRVDHTSAWRQLAASLRGEHDPLREVIGDQQAYDRWRARWSARLSGTDPQQCAAAMDAVNPLYLPRNHLVEQALAAAITGDGGPVTELLAVLADPYREQPGRERYSAPADAAFTAGYVTYCGT